MLELTKHQVKLSSVNPRAEIHGEERKPACDLKFEVTCANDVLIHFHPELRTTLFKKDEQPDLIDQAQPEALTALRFPKMGTVKWDWEGTGYTLTIDYGIGGKSDIKLGDCQVDQIRIDPMNGGSVKLGFRAICHPESKQFGQLCELIQQDVEITLTPPEPTSVQELFGEDSEEKQKEKKSTVLNPAQAWPFPKDKTAA
jgi:hypothetical protein